MFELSFENIICITNYRQFKSFSLRIRWHEINGCELSQTFNHKATVDRAAGC